MPTYVVLNKWTDQGIRNAKETVARAQQGRERLEQTGARLIAVYWTQGAYDVVSVLETQDEETAMALVLATGMQGNGRTETLRAFSAEEMQRILAKVP